MLGVAEVDQRVEAGDGFEDDVAALAAVAAVGAAIFDIFLAPERHGAGAAVAGLDEDLGLVEEMHGGAFGRGNGKLDAYTRSCRAHRPPAGRALRVNFGLRSKSRHSAAWRQADRKSTRLNYSH